MFQYYMHLIKIATLYILFTIISAFALKSSSVGLHHTSIIAAWFVTVAALRFLLLRYNKKPYTAVADPDLQKTLKQTKSIQVYFTPQPSIQSIDHIDFIIINDSLNTSHKWTKILTYAQQKNIPIITQHHFEEVVNNRLSFEQIHETWGNRYINITLYQQWSKRLADILLITLFLPLLMLISSITSIVILLTMGRPILYTQKRIGQHGVPFTIYKFRSMKNNTSHQGETQNNDNRITKIGAIIRKYRIDELPQIINVIRSEMSIIGPRPEWTDTAENFEKKIPLYDARHVIKPGITGWAQVHQGHTTGQKGNQEKLQYDLYYIKHLSLFLDLEIILRTIYTIITGFKAR